MNILFNIKVEILVLIQWSYKSQVLLTIEHRMVTKHSPISFKHIVSFSAQSESQ